MAYYNDPDSEQIYWFSEDPRERQPGFLTYEMREFLTGENDLEGAAYTQARQRLRDRIRHSLIDFKYMQLLHDQEVKTIFEDIRNPPRPGEGQKLETKIGNGIGFLIGFLFHGIEQYSSADFETFVKYGIERGSPPRPSDRGDKFPNATVNIDVDWELHASAKIALERLREGEKLDQRELGVLVKWGDLTDKDWMLLREQNHAVELSDE